MLKIYSDNEGADSWLDTFIRDYPNIKKFKNFEEWQSGDSPRVAMFEIVKEEPDLLKKIEEAYLSADLVMIFIMEFLDDNICQRFDRPNIILFLPGHLNWQCQHAKTKFYPYFFYTVTNFYLSQPRWLSSLDKNKNNSLFDVLLGRRKPHRDIIYNKLSGSQHVVRYFSDQTNRDIRDRGPEEFYWIPGILENLEGVPIFTAQNLILDDFCVSISHVIPVEIYNQTQYTLVAETQFQNNFSFITEKTIKPLVAGRIFLVASSAHFLRNLRNLGFCTWDGIIDESYDLEPDLYKRLDMMLDQVDWLTKQDPQQIYQKAKPRIEHNQNLILSKMWWQDFIDEIKFLLLQSTNSN